MQCPKSTLLQIILSSSKCVITVLKKLNAGSNIYLRSNMINFMEEYISCEIFLPTLQELSTYIEFRRKILKKQVSVQKNWIDSAKDTHFCRALVNLWIPKGMELIILFS